MSPDTTAKQQAATDSSGAGQPAPFEQVAARFACVPLGKLRGVEEALAVVRGENRDVAYIAVSDPAGKLLYAVGRDSTRKDAPQDGAPAKGHDAAANSAALPAGNPDIVRLWPAALPKDGALLPGHNNLTLPLGAENAPAGFLHLGVPAKFIRDTFRSILYDNLTVLLVTVLVAFEILGFLLRHMVDVPLETVLGIIRRYDEMM